MRIRNIAFLSLLIFFTLPVNSIAQRKQGQARIDSLLATLPGRPEDTTLLHTYLGLSSTYRAFSLEKCAIYGRKALALGKKLGHLNGQARANNMLGDAAINANRYADALPHYLEAARLFEKGGNHSGLGNSYSNISEVYHRNGDKKKAYRYASLGVSQFTRFGGTNSSKAWAYVDLGNAALALGKKDEARTCYIKADSLSSQSGDILAQSSCTYFLGNFYQDEKNYALALAAHFKNLKLSSAHGTASYDHLLYLAIGHSYKLISEMPVLPDGDSLIPSGRTANRDRSIKYISLALNMCRTTPVSASDKRNILLDYADLMAQKGEYKKASEAYSHASKLGDTIAKAADGERIARLEGDRAMEIKDKDLQIAGLEVAKKQNAQWFFIAGLGLLVGIVGLMFRGNRLIKKEKKRSDDLLLNILPSEVAEELKDTGGAKARHFNEVSVLFTDFVNFTEIAEKLSPQELVQELHACFSAFDSIIDKHGMEKIKTIGDAYLAVSGLPVANAKHACACVEAGLEIRDFIQKRKAAGHPFEIRIGIHSGPVVAGIVGVKKFAYDIWGDTVNTAARMEQHSQAGQVNISQATYEMIKEEFGCSARGKVAAKNKGNIEMYFVEGVVVRVEA